jgi:uncharacterized membrane protein
MRCGCAEHPWLEDVVMMGFEGMSGGMWGMWLFGILILALIVLGIAALLKYLRS